MKSKKTINKIVAFDGKTITESDNILNKALHILTAFNTDNKLILKQFPVYKKTNQIKIADLIDLLENLFYL